MLDQGKRRGAGLRFYAAVTVWAGGLVALALLYWMLTGGPLEGSWSVWNTAYPLPAWTGLLLPFVAFAGGLAVYKSSSPRAVVLRVLPVIGLSYVLLAYASPMVEYQAQSAWGRDVAIEFPFGPGTPEGLRALRSAVQADPPATYSFSVDRPFDKPPNWLTYLIHSLMAIAGFAVLAALLGQQAGFLTSGLSPPARWNARWGLGLLSAVAFFLAEAVGGEWVRLEPSNSGILGAWLPLVVPVVELALLAFLTRRQRLRLHASPPPGV